MTAKFDKGINKFYSYVYYIFWALFILFASISIALSNINSEKKFNYFIALLCILPILFKYFNNNFETPNGKFINYYLALFIFILYSSVFIYFLLNAIQINMNASNIITIIYIFIMLFCGIIYYYVEIKSQKYYVKFKKELTKFYLWILILTFIIPLLILIVFSSYNINNIYNNS